MMSLARWCVRHRRLVALLWLVALVGATLLARTVGTAYASGFSLPHTESTQALDLLEAAAPGRAGDEEQIVVHTTGPTTVTDPAVEARVTAMLAKVAAFPHVTVIQSPYGPLGARQISTDGRTAFATVTFAVDNHGLTTTQSQAFVDLVTSAAGHGLEVAVAGQIAEQAARPSIGGTLPGVLLAGVVLFLVFGSFFAMALPIVSAMASLGTAIGVIGLLSHVLKMPDFSTELVLLIGLGVGIDYALFIVTRHRQGLLAGNDLETSIATAVNTSGRAVLFAGIIVCIALLGMFALGVSFLYGLAVAASIGVAFTMVAALTLLPAMLGFIGPRVLSRKQKRDLAANGPRIVGAGTSGFWPRWADFIRTRPVLPAVAALAVVLLAAVPFLQLRLGHADQGNDPKNQTTRQAYDLLASGFGPGFNGPLQLVAVHPGQADTATLGRLAAAIRTQPDVASVVPPVNLPARDGRQVSLIIVYPSSSPQAAATTDLIARLRTQTIPSVVDGSGTTVYVGGITAIFADFAHVLGTKLPLFVGLVVLLSFLLLTVVFRSLLIPLTAACMNLLSIGAAFGILVGVFQWGWFDPVFGVSRTGPIEAFLPVMMFAILFGLSMDYEVFLISRIHEEWLRSGDNRTAVRNGLAATGKTITAAALIMVLVFGAFILGGINVIKEFGLGLAGGIVMDAVFIRMAIVPALMFLFGRANWWLPAWLDRLLPHIAIDPDADGDGDGTTGGAGPAAPAPEPALV